MSVIIAKLKFFSFSILKNFAASGIFLLLVKR